MHTKKEQQVYEALAQLDIPYVRHEHPAVYTVEQANQHYGNIPGAHCKNLFLRNRKGDRHYLVIAESTKTVNLKDLNQQLDEKLSFASPERLMKYLDLEPGSVSPFGLINDTQREVLVLIDKDLSKAEQISFHPNVNTATLTLSWDDLKKFLSWCGHQVTYF